ncbi:MAG: efflux RND transporter periplasmic adaptor subunit [Parcubacteria group bacterium]
MSRTIRAGLALAAALVLAAGCGGKKTDPAAKPALTVTAVTVTPEPLTRTVEASGTITAWQEVPVGAETGGLRAVDVYADEGSYVRQGQVLVKMNDAVLVSQERQQAAALASAKAQLAQASAALSRAQELKGKGFLSQASLDQALAQQRTAAANVQAAQAALAETSTRRGQTDVRAPVSGLITSRSVVKGQIVAAGTELFRLVRDGRLELNAQIPAQDLAAVRAGMPATVMGNGVSTTGTVRIVTPQVDPQSRVGLARISLSPGSGLKPGMFATASIAGGAAPSLTVPAQSIIYRSDQSGVYVLDPTSHVHFRPVKTGQRVADKVEVLAGVNAGERVVGQGAGFLSDGDLVRVSR